MTLNYRIGIFGFPGAPNTVQNLGLLDQRIAIEWIRDNIAAFNGDATRITIVGQSSGSVAVDNWAYAFQSDPIVSGLAAHSGNVFSFPINTASLAASNWHNVTTQLGCGSPALNITSEETLNCMRRVNVSAILAAAGRVPPPPGSSVTRSQPNFQATVDNMTIFSIPTYTSRSLSGDFAPIPYLLGNTNYESGYYRVPARAQGNSPPESAWTQFQLESFTCPTAFQARSRAASDTPTWRFRYFGDWENLRLYEGSGAYHGSDLEMVVGNSEGVSGIPSGQQEKALTTLMQRAWAAFARDPVNGLVKEVGWERYNEHGEFNEIIRNVLQSL